MEERIVEMYRSHQLLSTLHAGKFKGRVWKDKALLNELEGSSVNDVLDKLKAFVDARFSEEAASRQEAPVELYVDAFRKIMNGLTDGHRAMLKAHYLAPNRCVTATQLAEAADYSSYGAANLQYGLVGKMLFEAMPMDIPKRDDGTPIWTFMLAVPGNKDVPEDQWLWQMKPEVAKAAEVLALNK